MNPPSLLLFDLGGVLVENSTFEDLKRLLRQPLENAALKERWLRSGAVRSFELGAITAPEFAHRFVDEWQLALSPEAFLTRFRDWPKGLYPGARELLAGLRGRYRVGCLSNANALHWAKFGGFADLFDVALSSHLLGAIKPDPAAFSRALHECRAGPHETWFFDDTITNVHAAQALGLRAFHVEGFTALEHLIQAEALLR